MAEGIVQQLDPIFRPRSIVFVGASNNPGKWGNRVLTRCLSGGYRGSVYAVNPGGKEIMGVPTYADVSDVPGEIDLAVFTVPAQVMPDAMGRCARKGIRGGVVITAGFSETGEHGRILEERTLEAARAGGLRFVGPNGMGIWSSAASLNLALEPSPKAGSIAFVSQSGTFGGNLAQSAMTKGYGLSKFISIGNQGDLKAADYLEYLAQDPETKVIVFYMEGFKDGRRFLEVAEKAVRLKPILIYKGGRSEVGARATMSHTGSIAGTDEVFEAVCRQIGAIRAYEVERVFDMAEALIKQPLPRGRRVGIIGSGGQGVVTVDCCAAYGLEVPELDAEASRMLKEVLPPHAPVPTNPVDFAGGGRTAVDEASVALRLASMPYIDGIIMNVPVNFTRTGSIGATTRVSIEGAEMLARIPAEFGKPVITLRWNRRPDDIVTEILKEAGIPSYNTPEDCAAALYALVRYAEIRAR